MTAVTIDHAGRCSSYIFRMDM